MLVRKLPGTPPPPPMPRPVSALPCSVRGHSLTRMSDRTVLHNFGGSGAVTAGNPSSLASEHILTRMSDTGCYVPP
jgi:hypothetical protein